MPKFHAPTLPRSDASTSRYGRFVIAVLVVFAFITPIKFGTPVVIQSAVIPPTNFVEWIYFSWPNQLAVMAAFGALVWMALDKGRAPARPGALLVLPLVWLATQAVATPGSINRQVSADTLLQFATCVLVFYAAAWYVRDAASARKIFGGLALATAAVCGCALQQHFGGLEATRRMAAEQLNMESAPPDYLLRLTSNRVFAWFGGYPNALAGFLVVAFAPVLAYVWMRGRNWEARAKWVLLVLAGVVMAACLAFTGSRGGFVAFAVMIVAGIAACSAGRARKGAPTIIAVTLAMLAGGFWLAQRGGLTHSGMSSVESRLDYWRGAVAIARDFPWLGTGPGTFGSIYPKYKTAQSEEAKLVHNNFLQMWSDSGVAAWAAYAALWIVALWRAFRLTRQRSGDPAAIAVCAALTGWVAHGLVDFDLYVPGVALPAFVLLGMVQGLSDTSEPRTVASPAKARVVLVAACAFVAIGAVWVEARMLEASFVYANLVTKQPLIEDARRAAALAPASAQMQTLAGDVALVCRQPEEALTYYRAAVRCDRFGAGHHRRLAEALVKIHGDTPEAREEFRLARELNPTAKEKVVRHPPDGLLESRPTEER